MSIRTFAPSPAASTRRVASMPSSSGMRMSISTTSGCEPLGLLDRLQAVGGLADHVEVVLGVEDHPEPGAHERLVVGDQHPHRAHAAASTCRLVRHERQLRTDPEAAAAPPPGLELAAVELHALAHADEAVAAVAAEPLARRAGAAVGDLELELALAPAHVHLGGRVVGVLERVRQPLLHDAEGGEVEPGGQRAPLALDVQLDRQAGLARALDERADARHRRLRGARVVLVVVAVQDAEQPPHLGERLAARALDLRRGGDRALRVALEDPPRAAGLHDHHADAVRDDVVHLARDPAALVGRGALRLELVRLLLAHAPPRAAPR